MSPEPEVPWETAPEPEPTSRYAMPAVPPGFDWLVSCERNEVAVQLRSQHKVIRTTRFQFSSDDYTNAALAVDAAESILRTQGPIRQLNLTCLDNFSPGPGVVTK